MGALPHMAVLAGERPILVATPWVLVPKGVHVHRAMVTGLPMTDPPTAGHSPNGEEDTSGHRAPATGWSPSTVQLGEKETSSLPITGNLPSSLRSLELDRLNSREIQESPSTGHAWSDPYLKCLQRRLYSAWKIADIYLRRSAEYWDALSASLRKLEIFSVRTSAIFPYAGPQLSAERSVEVCGHLRTSLRTSMRTSAWIGADVRMDWCGRPHGLVQTSAWMGADVCGSQRIC